jgi:hypothetical protein
MENDSKYSRSDIHEITHALEAAGFEVYAVRHQVNYNLTNPVSLGIIDIQVKARGKTDE